MHAPLAQQQAHTQLVRRVYTHTVQSLCAHTPLRPRAVWHAPCRCALFPITTLVSTNCLAASSFPRTALRLVRGTRGRVAVANEKSAVLCSQRQRVGRLVVVVEGRGGREAEEDRAGVLRSMSRIRPYLKNRSCGRHGPTAKKKKQRTRVRGRLIIISRASHYALFRPPML